MFLYVAKLAINPCRQVGTIDTHADTKDYTNTNNA